ncbi:hypothetical protein GCM10023213_20010 [Prosthecobacter algae]|uniref:Uncharacterized protein n=1 Tax=Prosthecobacter algae TaxID=1144682 RepID=A0ABP9P2K8_9BACT
MKRLLSLLALAVFSVSAPAADLSITAANVLASANARFQDGTAGATLTRGMLVYADATDGGKIKPADGNVLAAKGVLGMAYGDVAAGQFVRVIIDDPDLTVGATLSLAAPGGIYVLSATAGGICPVADLAAGSYPIVVLVAKSATKAHFHPRLLQGSAVLVAP